MIKSIGNRLILATRGRFRLCVRAVRLAGAGWCHSEEAFMVLRMMSRLRVGHLVLRLRKEAIVWRLVTRMVCVCIQGGS